MTHTLGPKQKCFWADSTVDFVLLRKIKIICHLTLTAWLCGCNWQDEEKSFPKYKEPLAFWKHVYFKCSPYHVSVTNFVNGTNKSGMLPLF